MATDNIHTIRKVSLGVSSPKGGSPFAMQEDVANWWENELKPKLQVAFDEFKIVDEIIQIPKLDIVINADKGTDWQQGATKEIISKLKEQLSDQISTAGKIVSRAQSKEEQKKAVRFSASLNVLETLSTYLVSGTLPWSISTSGKEVIVQQIAEAVEHSDFTPHREKLLLLLREQETARIRLSNLLAGTKGLIIDFYAALIPGLPVTLLNTWQEVIQTIANKAAQQHLQILFAANNAISRIAVESKTITAEKLMEEFEILVSGFIDKGIIGIEALNAIKNTPLPAPYDSIFITIAKNKATVDGVKAEKSRHEKIKEVTEPEVALTEEKLQQQLEQNILQNKKEEINKKEVERIAEDGIYISNAGLVLAAPFLNALFEKTELAKDYKIQDIDKAVCLVGYIVNGLQQQPEYELLLPKILCGVGMEQAIDSSVYLDDMLTTEADEMLKSLVEHWSVLGDTSVDGLRTSFLKRDGKLSFKNNEWLLQVEQKAYDMLLQQEPWNYNWIKLPWMPNLLKTEWVS